MTLTRRWGGRPPELPEPVAPRAVWRMPPPSGQTAATSLTVDGGPPWLGGMRFLSAAWLSPTSLRVAFSSIHGASCLYQLYAGRTRIGATRAPTQRSLVGQLVPSAWPQHLQLVAVAPADVETDYGPRLPLRPYNRVKLLAQVAGQPDDVRYVEVTAGTEPGGAVDDANVLERVLFDVDRWYEVLTPPLAGSGTWNFEIATVDDKPPSGNRSVAAEVAASVVAHPPDVALVGGSRLSVSVEAGVATVSWTN